MRLALGVHLCEGPHRRNAIVSAQNTAQKMLSLARARPTGVEAEGPAGAIRMGQGSL